MIAVIILRFLGNDQDMLFGKPGARGFDFDQVIPFILVHGQRS